MTVESWFWTAEHTCTACAPACKNCSAVCAESQPPVARIGKPGIALAMRATAASLRVPSRDQQPFADRDQVLAAELGQHGHPRGLQRLRASLASACVQVASGSPYLAAHEALSGTARAQRERGLRQPHHAAWGCSLR